MHLSFSSIHVSSRLLLDSWRWPSLIQVRPRCEYSASLEAYLRLSVLISLSLQTFLWLAKVLPHFVLQFLHAPSQSLHTGDDILSFTLS